MVNRLKVHAKLFALIGLVFLITGAAVRHYAAAIPQTDYLSPDMIFGGTMGMAIVLLLLSIVLDHGSSTVDSSS